MLPALGSVPVGGVIRLKHKTVLIITTYYRPTQTQCLIACVGRAPKEEPGAVSDFCSSVLFQPGVLVMGSRPSLGKVTESKR